MITPPPLKAGDAVGIVATARKISKEELAPALDWLRAKGLRPVLGESIGLQQDQFAGSDALRAHDFQHMLDDPSIKSIWCARGGYGTVRMIDAVNFSILRSNPKWIMGYSDITVLHCRLHWLGIQSIHAQMPLGIHECTEETLETLFQALSGSTSELSYSPDLELRRTGRAQGVLVGGNLSVLYSLCGSPDALDTHGKILVLEDLDEYLYHVDRMMQNLKRNGVLNDLSGLLVGGMTGMNDNQIPFGSSAEEIVMEAVQEFDYPVAFNAPLGHVADNRALVLGKPYTLEVTNKLVSLG